MSDVTKFDFPDYAYILFDDICDIIGPSEHWPERVLKLFWSKHISQWERFMICAFVVVNGLNPEVFLEWIDVIGMAHDYNSLREIKSLLQTFTENPGKWDRAYAYNILNHRYEYINGNVKCYLDYSVKRPCL